MFPSKLEAEVTSKSKDPERDSHSDAGYLSHKDKTFDPDVHMAIPTEKGALWHHNLGFNVKDVKVFVEDIHYLLMQSLSSTSRCSQKCRNKKTTF